VAVLDGELTIKRLYMRAGVVKLVAANPAYPDIELKADSDLEVWGVVTTCIKRLV
jgi:DNA polymerase V